MLIVNHILGNLKDRANVPSGSIDFVPVDWFDTQKTILRLTSESGRDICIRQEMGGRLRDGDILEENPNTVTVIQVRPCEVLKIKLETADRAARLGWELGNRHLPVVIGENEITVPYDEPTFSYLRQLGFSLERAEEVFTGSLVSHHHEHG